MIPNTSLRQLPRTLDDDDLHCLTLQKVSAYKMTAKPMGSRKIIIQRVNP